MTSGQICSVIASKGYTVKEVCELTGLSRQTIYRYRQSGLLKVRFRGPSRKPVITGSSIQTLLMER